MMGSFAPVPGNSELDRIDLERGGCPPFPSAQTHQRGLRTVNRVPSNS